MKNHLIPVEEQVVKLKNKNVQFNIMKEEEAIKYLRDCTYYKKITSYWNNYHYCTIDGKKKYSNLEFVYLVELARLDSEFRSLVMQMCLYVEHSLKIKIINLCLDNREDGYEIVKEFFASYEDILNKILKNANNSYCMELILENQNNMPLWVLVEVMSFGDLCHLYKFIIKKYGLKDKELDIIFTVRDFRNAAAHSHCLFSKLQASGGQPSAMVSQFISNIDSITKTERKNRLSSKCLLDFVTLLYAFEYYVKEEEIIINTKTKIRRLFYDRMLEKSEYFGKCLTIKNAYNFIKKVLDEWL